MRYRSLKRLVDPAAEPVTLAEMKSHLRLEHDADDSLVGAIISSAREWCEEYCERTFTHAQWQMGLDGFPAAISLPRPPMATAAGFTAVTVSYETDAGVLVNIPSADFRVFRDETPGVLRPIYNGTWPSHRLDYGSVTVTWWAGYGASGSDVPQRVRSAIMLLGTHLYEQRSAVLVGQGWTQTPLAFSLTALLDTAKWGAYA
jgi:uncharacterized phiE125 gp8 family phage protein